MSHLTYTNFNKATTDLVTRIGDAVELELSPHMISHCSTDQRIIKTNALKVVTTAKDSKAVLNGLIRALTVTPAKFRTLTTRNFKLIHFQDNEIDLEGLTELITRQNGFLHYTVEILVIGGYGVKTCLPQ